MPTRALTWTIFIAAAVIVAGLCVAILRPFAHVIAWAATLAILCYPLAMFFALLGGYAGNIMEALRQPAVARPSRERPS
jgi:predicted PurR-regulated permease PerM